MTKENATENKLTAQSKRINVFRVNLANFIIEQKSSLKLQKYDMVDTMDEFANGITNDGIKYAKDVRNGKY